MAVTAEMLAAKANHRSSGLPWLAAGLVALTAVRLFALSRTPLQLYPDEAQYWLWSRRLAWGYFSKPPMVAWLIRGSTALGGDAEFWVRLPAALIAAATPLVIYAAGARLSGPREGAAAGLIFALMPAMQLAAGVIATDAPLLLFLALALYAYAAMWTAPAPGTRWRAAAGLGAALGLAFLAKYAASYFVLGLGLHALCSRRARALWRAREALAAAGVCLLILAPHLVWSAQHGFSTLRHAAGNAAARGRAGVADPRGPLGFVVGQFCIFGPIPMAVLLLGAARGRAREEPDRLLLCLTAPALLVVLVEAALVRANANWAAAAFAPASVLVGVWLVRWRARRTLVAAAGLQGALAAAFLAAAVQPALADRLGLGAALKYARGRAEQAALVGRALTAAGGAGPVTAVATDYRFDFNTLAYYGRDLFDVARPAPMRPGRTPLRMWGHEGRAMNQADVDYPLTPAEGARVLFVNAVPGFAGMERGDFGIVTDAQPYAIRLDRKRVRRGVTFVGERFRPLPHTTTNAREPDGS